MNSTQYTIRSIPAKLDRKLREQARKTGKSLNETIIESLAKGSGIDLKEQTFHDLDWFIGSMPEDDPGFDEAMRWLDSLSNDIPEVIE